MASIGSWLRGSMNDLSGAVKRFVNQGFLDAVLSASALISTADGMVSPDEIQKIYHVLYNTEALRAFSQQQVRQTFDRIIYRFQTNYAVAQAEAFETIARIRNSRESAELVVRIAGIISNADGHMSQSELVMLHQICKELYLDPNLFNLPPVHGLGGYATPGYGSVQQAAQQHYAPPVPPISQPNYAQPVPNYAPPPPPQPAYGGGYAQPTAGYAAPVARPPMPSGGVSLRKGENISLMKNNPNLSQIMVGLGWDKNYNFGGEFDVDASAFMLDQTGRVASDQHFIFYNQPTSPCGAVRYGGDNRTGAGAGDDELVGILLPQVAPFVQKIVFAVTIHEADMRRQNFGMIQNAYIRIVNVANQQEIVRYYLTDYAQSETAMIFGELYRHQMDWKFRAIGQGYSGGLRALAMNYGVNVS